MKDCIICGGSRRITLPVRPRLVVYEDGDGDGVSGPLSSGAKQYPCPECTGLSEDHVDTLQVNFLVTAHEDFDDPNIRRHLLRDAAYRIANEAVERGYISLSVSKRDDEYTVGVAARMSIVDRASVTSIEERAARYEEHVARDLVDKLMSEVRLWGSYYGRTVIEKDKVGEYAAQAVKHVLKMQKLRRDAHAEGFAEHPLTMG